MQKRNFNTSFFRLAPVLAWLTGQTGWFTFREFTKAFPKYASSRPGMTLEHFVKASLLERRIQSVKTGGYRFQYKSLISKRPSAVVAEMYGERTRAFLEARS